ncbi:MAG: GNAT family N-acetyltransferase [Anaerolineae bacterium]|nr:GNAT family N-acetyltransferase [Anaerolineae bacterium]
MMLEGLLVDLVPYGDRYKDRQHDWRNSEAWFWLDVGNREFATHASIERDYERYAERQAEHRSPNVTFGIQTKDGKPLGLMSLNWVIPHLRLSMLGAGIGEQAYWNGGYGTDALLLIVDYAFDWLDMRRLWLATMGPNVRVHRQMEKVGFTQEVRHRQALWVEGHGWVDEVMYGLLREEWPGRDAVIARLGLVARAE